MYPCPNDGGAPGIYAYRALVPPFGIDPGTAMFSFEYGGNVLLRSQPLAEILSLWSGLVETFDMTFPFTSVTVSATKRLADLLPADMRNTVTHLKVLGEMTATDFNLINAWMPLIISLDLSGATVEGDVIPGFALDEKTSLKEFIFPMNIKEIGNNAFYMCSGLNGSLTIPEGVTTIGVQAFLGCSGFTGSLSIPQSVTTIGRSAFSECSGFIGSLTIPQSVTSISDYAFRKCSGFTSLTIPQGVTSIGNYAFYECAGFTSLTIPQSVTSIGYCAFYGCNGLTSITCHVSEPDKVTYDSGPFDSIPNDIPVHVPAAAVDAYRNHYIWKRFTNIQAIPQL